MSDRDEAIEYLRYAVSRGWLWCQNCDGRKCMDCVCSVMHDKCAEDCFACCGAEKVHYAAGVSFGSVLPQGWDKP